MRVVRNSGPCGKKREGVSRRRGRVARKNKESEMGRLLELGVVIYSVVLVG